MRRALLTTLLCGTLAGCGATNPADPTLPTVDGSSAAGGATGGSTGSVAPAAMCSSCASNSDCGDGAHCVLEGNPQPAFCAPPCSSDSDCPQGATCFSLDDGSAGCYPSAGTCVAPSTNTGSTGSTTSGASSTGSSTTGNTYGGGSGSAGCFPEGTFVGTGLGSQCCTGAVDGYGYCTTNVQTNTSGTTGTSSTTGTTGTSGTTTGTTSASSSSGSTTGSVCTPDTWTNFAKAFFQNNCNGCHSFTTQSSVRNSASSIKSDIQSGVMPKRATLSSSDKSRILTWLSCGEP